jgi:prevent-host-death family protein
LANGRSRPSKVTAVGVRELRQNLSVYLDQVKRGAVLQVTEHGRVVATLQPLAEAVTRLDRLEAQGLVRRPLKPVSGLPAPRRMPPGSPTSASILDDLSSDRL